MQSENRAVKKEQGLPPEKAGKEKPEKGKKPVKKEKPEKKFGRKHEKKEGTGAKIIPISKFEKKDAPAKKEGKTPRQKQENGRFTVSIGMAVCMCFIMGWCVTQTIRNINNGTQVIDLQAPSEVVETNEQGDGKTLNVDALAKKVLDNVAFDGELERLEDSVAEGMITTTEGTRLQVYMGNGRNADELVIMTARNEKDAEKNQTYVEDHIDEIKKQFATYIPEQVKKIDNAVKIRTGSYVIVCITSDTETAKRTIESFLKQ